MAGLTYEELMAKQGQLSQDPDEDSFEQGLTFGELQAKAKLAAKDPGFEMSGLGDITRKYLKGVNPDIMEEWYNRSASRSLGGWVTEKLISALPGGKEAVSNLQRPKQEAPTDTSILEDVQAALGQIISNPKETAIEMGKDFLANPELIGFGALSGARAGKRLADAAKLGRAGRAAGTVAGSAFEGAVGMGAQEAALQLKYEDVDWKKVGTSATAGALINPLFQGAIAGAGKLLRGKPGEPGQNGPEIEPDIPPNAPDPRREPPFTRTPTATKFAAQMDDPEFNATREAASEAPYRAETQPEIRSPQFDKVANLQQKAYDLMQRGASIKEVEGVLKSKSKADRAIMEAAMDEFRTRRASAADSFGRAQQGEIFGPDVPAVIEKVTSDPELRNTLGAMAIVGGTTAGLMSYATPEQQEEIATAATALGGVLSTRGKMPSTALAVMPRSALGPLLAAGKYTLRTLDRLPQNQTEFHPAQVRQELNKPGTPAAEKAVLEATIAKAEAEGRKVTAQELVSDFRIKTGDHTLTPKYTDEHSDFGSENIRKENVGNWVLRGQPTPVRLKYKTIIWQFPEYMNVATTNHFGDPRYYGHTREFRENDVDHVMEIQSDLAQNIRKPITPEQRTALHDELATLESKPGIPLKDLTQAQQKRWRELQLSRVHDITTQAVQGKKSNTEIGTPGYAPLTPALKNAENRLIREKLAEAAAKGDESVRFASADTVGKVEAWPGNHAHIQFLKQRLADVERSLAINGPYFNPAEWPTHKARYEETAKDLRAKIEATKPFFNDPGHQSLYDRYAKETTSYLKKLGGKEVMDAENHTWLEVPTGVNRHIFELNKSAEDLRQLGAEVSPEHTALKAFYDEEVGKLENEVRAEQSKQVDTRPFGGRPDAHGRGPIEMYGQADPRLLAAIAATGLATATYLALPDAQKEGVKNYLQAVGALAVVAGMTKGKYPGDPPGKVSYKFLEKLDALEEAEAKSLMQAARSLENQYAVSKIKETHIPEITALQKLGDSVRKIDKLPAILSGEAVDTVWALRRLDEMVKILDTTRPEDAVMAQRNLDYLLRNNEVRSIFEQTIRNFYQTRSELNMRSSRDRALAKQMDSLFESNVIPLVRNTQNGVITPDQAVKLAALTSGAAIGGYLAGDETLAGAVIGGIGGLAATRLPTLGRSIGKVLSPQNAFGTAVRISAALGAGYYLGGKVDHPIEGAAVASALLLGRKFLKPAMAREGNALINIRNGNLNVWDILRHNIVRDINKLVPDAARREAISEAIQVGARNHLTPAEREVYDFVTQMNARIGNDAVDAKVLRSLRQNYITSIVELETTITPSARQALIDKILGKAFPENLGPNTRFARQRKYDTFAELNQALEGSGLKLKTKDVGEIFEIYSKSMRKAIEDRILLDSLKAAKGADDLPYVSKRDKYGRFPAGFRRINHPQLENMAVHPELYDSLKAVMENDNPDIITAGLYGASMAVKRLQVFGSLFHAKSLGEVYLLAMGTDVLPRIGDLKRPKTVIDAALKKFHEAKLGDEITGLARAGLKLGVPDDVKTSIIGDLGKLADTATGTRIAGKIADKVDYVNKHLDHATWDYMHSGVKSTVALDAVAKLTRNNAELHAKDPVKYPLKSKQEIYTEAARFANDVTGGLDWFRIATEAKTELGRSVALHFASPQGRRVAQILIFAPDWALSTLRAGFNAFGKSETGFHGLLKPTNAVDLYRQYALRSAAIWLTLLNGIQYGLTGRPIWENKDPTRIAYADGTSIQPGKHSAEAVHAVMDPTKFAMNKLGYFPSLAADVAAYRHGSGFMAMSPHSPVTYAALKAAPFTASPLFQPHLSPEVRIGRSISGGLGFPLHGMNQEQKLLARSERLSKAAEKRAQ